MDNELLLSIAILAGLVVATAFERRAKAARARAEAEAARAPICVLVKVPESITSFDRRERYADPLDGALLRESLGRVTGSEVGISVELTALERGVALIKRELLRLGVPKDTTLEFTRNRVHVDQGVHGSRSRGSSGRRGVDVSTLCFRALSLRHVLVRLVRQRRGNAHSSAGDTGGAGRGAGQPRGVSGRIAS